METSFSEQMIWLFKPINEFYHAKTCISGHPARVPPGAQAQTLVHVPCPASGIPIVPRPAGVFRDRCKSYTI